MNDDSHPVLTCAEAIELEQELLAGDSAKEWQAMTRAGRALGRALLLDFREGGDLPENSRVLILSGKGHNAGDAFIAAREILNTCPATTIDVLFVMGEQALNPLARRAWSDLLTAGGERAAVKSIGLDRRREIASQLKSKCGGHYHLCLDGIFGMNFRPPFRPPADEVVRWINDELKADLRAAVDLPSGVGDEPGGLAFRAGFSYMTGSAKLPLFEPAQAEWAGRLRYLDIGFFGQRPDPRSILRKEGSGGFPREVLLPNVLNPLRQLRSPMTHKRKFGHLLLVGGSRLMPGAILMSIMAAARSGVGLVTAAVPESLVASFAAVVPEAMWIGCPETEEGGLAADSLRLLERAMAKASVVLVGPGVGTEAETQALAGELAKKIDIPLIIDAEALQPELIKCLASRKEMNGRVVVTPHMGEYARISGQQFAETGEKGLIEFCRQARVLTLLKGPPFTRFCDGAKIFYGLSGGPVLARGGSGDILAGLVGSLVAQAPDGVPHAVRRAIVWHGLAAEALARERGQTAVRTTQLLDFLSCVLRESGG